MDTPLTNRQLEVLRYIEECIEEALPPTRADICEQFGFKSPTAADDHMKALQNKGCIELYPGVARGVAITPLGYEQLEEL